MDKETAIHVAISALEHQLVNAGTIDKGRVILEAREILREELTTLATLKEHLAECTEQRDVAWKRIDQLTSELAEERKVVESLRKAAADMRTNWQFYADKEGVFQNRLLAKKIAYLKEEIAALKQPTPTPTYHIPTLDWWRAHPEAKWVGTDLDGSVNWSSGQPNYRPDLFLWQWYDGNGRNKVMRIYDGCLDWRDSLIARPAEADRAPAATYEEMVLNEVEDAETKDVSQLEPRPGMDSYETALATITELTQELDELTQTNNDKWQYIKDLERQITKLERQDVSQGVDHLEYAKACANTGDGQESEGDLAKIHALIAIAEELKLLRISAEEMVGR